MPLATTYDEETRADTLQQLEEFKTSLARMAAGGAPSSLFTHARYVFALNIRLDKRKMRCFIIIIGCERLYRTDEFSGG